MVRLSVFGKKCIEKQQLEGKEKLLYDLCEIFLDEHLDTSVFQEKSFSVVANNFTIKSNDNIIDIFYCSSDTEGIEVTPTVLYSYFKNDVKGYNYSILRLNGEICSLLIENLDTIINIRTSVGCQKCVELIKDTLSRNECLKKALDEKKLVVSSVMKSQVNIKVYDTDLMETLYTMLDVDKYLVEGLSYAYLQTVGNTEVLVVINTANDFNIDFQKETKIISSFFQQRGSVKVTKIADETVFSVDNKNCAIFSVVDGVLRVSFIKEYFNKDLIELIELLTTSLSGRYSNIAVRESEECCRLLFQDSSIMEVQVI